MEGVVVDLVRFDEHRGATAHTKPTTGGVRDLVGSELGRALPFNRDALRANCDGGGVESMREGGRQGSG